MILPWIVKPALVVLLAYVAQWAVRQRGAAARHLVWTAALLFVAIVPLLPSELFSAPALTLVALTPGSSIVDDAAPFIVDATTTPARSTFPIHAFWIAGLLAVVAQWLLPFRKAIQLARRSRSYTTYRNVPVRLSDATCLPFTFGWREPVIVLPAQAEHWTEVRRTHVLAHEFAHVARYDWLTQSLARAVCAMYWFHPLVWLAAAAMRRESENACDDAAILATEGGPAAYAEDLFQMACDCRDAGNTPASALTMWGNSKSQLEVRVKNILNPLLNRRPLTPAVAAAVACGALALFLPVVGLRLQAQPAKVHLGGEVRDPSGAAVPGAKIELRTAASPKTVAASGVTGPDGKISMEIEPDTYTFTVLHPGFAPVTGGPLSFTNAKAELFVALRLGQIRETVSVIGVRPPSAPASNTGAPQRIRVGGLVQAASLIHKVDPLYPADLQAQNIQGHIELDAVISKEGNVINVHERSLGQHPGLVQAATDAVRQWRYKPTLLNGEPVEVLTTVTVRFLLN